MDAFRRIFSLPFDQAKLVTRLQEEHRSFFLRPFRRRLFVRDAGFAQRLSDRVLHVDRIGRAAGTMRIRDPINSIFGERRPLVRRRRREPLGCINIFETVTHFRKQTFHIIYVSCIHLSPFSISARDNIQQNAAHITVCGDRRCCGLFDRGCGEHIFQDRNDNF
ncbi:hypothetical protein AQ753_17365 [Burkholderia pseudomallei]|nr:hypothetical protein AQ753_17365 [Burkholderia pseudomallei]OMT15662.1 hypothetical protein AQ754_22000 [Burkholderia pseudomallei]OMT23516.1 hypothetical protein AQ755_14565 [Burkholderia pseudomallei]